MYVFDRILTTINLHLKMFIKTN